MAKFVLAYKGGAMGATEAEQKQILAAWGEWFGKLGPAIVDGGAPFGPAMSVASNKSTSSGGSSALTGYSILQADNLNAATEMAKGCPVLIGGGSVEVYEAMPVAM
jgi:hypothetical protein